MEKSSFFNSVDGDRKYKAAEFAEYFSSFIGNGVFPNPSTNLQIASNNNMTIVLRQGRAWINGYFYVNTDDLVLKIATADGTLNRIDRVVLRLDFIKREIKAGIKKGDSATNAIVKPLQRDADIYELALADITVNKGVVSITQANITDLRFNKSLCGIVKGTIEEIDTTTIFNQYNGKLDDKILEIDKAFKEWFRNVQNQLQGNVATNFANDIAKLKGAVGEEVLATTKKTATGAINELKTAIETTNKNIDLTNKDIESKFKGIKVPVTKVNGKDGEVVLSASDIKNSEGKTIETKITELFQSASSSLQQVNSGKVAIAGVVGSVTGQNSFQEIANYITAKKNEIGSYLGAGDYGSLQRLCDWTNQRRIDAANQLSAKGVNANANTENLGQLISKIAQIQTKKKVVGGNFTIDSPQIESEKSFTKILNELSFIPDIFIIKIPLIAIYTDKDYFGFDSQVLCISNNRELKINKSSVYFMGMADASIDIALSNKNLTIKFTPKKSKNGTAFSKIENDKFEWWAIE